MRASRIILALGWILLSALALAQGANQEIDDESELDLTPDRGQVDQRVDALDVALLLEDAFAQVAEEVGPSVVGITVFEKAGAESKSAEGKSGWREASRRDDRYPDHLKIRSGSGVLVSDDGYILTCSHVLANAELIDVEFAGDVHWRGRVIGTEPTVNLAVIKVDVPVDVPPALLGNSDTVRVGSWAIALGDPEGAERTFSAGTISARPIRDCYQEQLSRTYLQSSVRIHPESYGGPLVNITGEVVGINTPRYETGVESLEPPAGGSVYALPINLVKTLYEALKEAESQRSPWLGISVLHLSPQLRGSMESSPPTGIYIDDVFDPSPAATVGVQVGDVLVSMDGNRILSVAGFQRWLYLLGIGKTIEIEIFRDGQIVKKTVTIEQRPADASTS